MRIDDSYTGLTQWDTGRKIILDQSETCDQVHFTNRSFGTTFDMQTYQYNGDLVANIPDELLQSSSPLMVYCYVVREDGESTTVAQEFPVRSRNKPLGYIYDPDDQMRIKEFNEFVDDTIEEMNGIKSDVEATVVHQPKIQNGTWWIWSFDENDYTDSGVKAQGPQGIQGLQGDKGDRGPQGDKGEPARINGVPTITIKGGTNIELEQTGTDLTINNTQQILMDFPDYIVTDGTMDDLLQSLDDNNLPTGNIYLGGVTCSDLPEGMVQAELKIEAIKNSDDLSVYYFTISSTEVHPYLWTATGFRNFSGWQARPLSDDIPTKTSDLVNDNNFISEPEVESNYVKNTAVATSTKLGLVKVADTSGIELEADGDICINAATEAEIDTKTEKCKPIVPATLDYAVKSVTTDKLSADEDAPVSSKAVKTALDETAKTGKNNNFSAAQTINGTLTVNGDIVQNGEAYETHAEQLYTKKDLIKTREGAVGGLGEGELTGIEAEKYDGEHNGRLAFDADGTARVGDVGDEQPLLTREEVANLVDGQVLVWDGTKLKAVTSDEYVKNTDYPTSSKAGVIKVVSYGSSGLTLDSDKYLKIAKASNRYINARESSFAPIVPSNLNYAVKAALSDAKRISDMTDEEKANARGVIGAINKEQLDELKQKSIPHTTESGYPIKIDDQLADETPLKCNIHGCKNLIPYPYSDTTKTANGITWTDNGDGSITVNGTTTATKQAFFYILLHKTDMDTTKRYVLSGSTPDVCIYVSLSLDNVWKKDIYSKGEPVIVDFPSYTNIEYNQVSVSLYVSEDTTVDNVTIKPQLEIGTTATDYEPYQLLGDLDSTDQKYKIPLIVYGKNMLDADKFKYYTTEESKKLFTTPIYFKAGKKYTFSFKSATSPKKWRLMMLGTETDGTPLKVSETGAAASAGWYMIGMYTAVEGRIQDSMDRATTSYTYTCNKDFICTKIMYWNTTNGASDTITGAMLEESDTATVYELYIAPQTITASLDSALKPDEYIDIVSKKRYKGSTISDITVSGDLKLTDSDVNTMLCSTSLTPSRIELSYYQDINKVIEKMTNAILAQGGNV